MVGKGPTVAHAQIKADVNADGINEQIVDEVGKAGDGVNKHGDEHGEDYGDHFSEGADRRFRDRMPKIFGRLTEGSKRGGHDAGSAMGDEASDEFAKRMESMVDRLGDRMGKSLGKKIGKSLGKELAGVEGRIGQMLDNLKNEIGSVSGNSGGGGGGGTTSVGGADDSGAGRTSIQYITRVNHLTEQFEKNRARLHEQANKAIEKHDSDLLKDQRSLYDRIVGMEKAKSEFIGKFEAARVKLREDSNKAIEKDDDRLRKKQEKAAAAAFARSEKLLRVQQRALVNRLRDEAKERDKIERDLIRRGKGTAMSDRLGSLFGAGSRNNFINFIGQRVKNLAQGIEAVVKGGKTLVSTFKTGFREAGDDASLFAKTMSGMSATASMAMTSLVESAPGAVLAIGAIVFAGGLMASILSALAGIITALSSTIVSGLTGALLVAAPLMAALAAAGGLVTIAFTSMTNAQKKMLKEAFRPLKEELTGIGQQILRPMAQEFDQWSSNLQRSLLLIAPYATKFGQAFAHAGDIITNSFSGRGFTALSKSLGTFLPSIVDHLSRAFGKFLNGVAGIFAALMPLVDRFAGYLQRVATDFANWANSARGRNQIVDFANRAVDSLKSLWGFIRETGGLLGDILFNRKVQRAGDGMFDGITRALRQMRNAFHRASNDGSLERWLKSAKKFGKAFWEVLKSLFGTFKALEDSGTIDGIAGALRGFASVVKVLNRIIDPMNGDIAGIGSAATLALGPIAPLVNALEGVIGTAKLALQMLGLVSGASGPNLPGLNAAGNAKAKGWQSTLPSANRLHAQKIAPQVTLHAKRPHGSSLSDLIGTGHDALEATSKKYGGYAPDPLTPAQKKAEERRKAADAKARREAAAARAKARREAAAARRAAIRDANRSAQQAVRQMMNSKDIQEYRQLLNGEIESMRSLGGKQGKRAMRVLRNARDVSRNRVGRILDDDISKADRRKLINGTDSLGTLVLARQRVAAQLEKANDKLAAAIALRDDFRKATADAIKAYGGILTVEKRQVDGVEQALTANDVTLNLQNRLIKIRKFTEDLALLSKMGLNNKAYKQLVEGGVDGSGETAAALVAGGSQAITQVNVLSDQISKAGNALGKTASTRLYQAGVDAARGLVHGLQSMDKQLDAAAERLGNRIAHKIKHVLGIKSPSTVMMAHMDMVGAGLVKGLDRQHGKVESATARLGARIAVSPEVAAYAAAMGQPATVSGNQPLVGHVSVHTPTTDPEAVAHEVVNEIVGRL